MKEPGTLAGYAAYLAARTRQATAYLDLGREMMALSGIVTGADGEWLLLSGERGRNLCAAGALVRLGMTNGEAIASDLRLDMEGPAGSRGVNEDLWDRFLTGAEEKDIFLRVRSVRRELVGIPRIHSEEILVLESLSGSRSRWERKTLLLLVELP